MKVYDMAGKLVESKSVKANEISTQKVGQQYPSGTYKVIVSQGGIIKNTSPVQAITDKA